MFKKGQKVIVTKNKVSRYNGAATVKNIEDVFYEVEFKGSLPNGPILQVVPHENVFIATELAILLIWGIK